jgi:phosphoribosylglycinamide formyltransferase 1
MEAAHKRQPCTIMASGNLATLAILASGTGSNADKICAYFSGNPDITVGLIISNKSEAGVLRVADKHGIPSAYISKKYWPHPELILPVLEEAGITHIILAGYLALIPEWLITAYENKIINIHPALLPKYGGQGMYGHHVHEAVKSAGDTISGITIHEVNAHYDEGRILFQKEVQLHADDDAETIGAKVLQVEHQYFARVIEAWIKETLGALV